MKKSAIITHVILLGSEISIVMTLISLMLIPAESTVVVAECTWIPVAMVAVGFGFSLAVIIARHLFGNSMCSRKALLMGVLTSLFVAGIGVGMAAHMFPTLLRFAAVDNCESRWRKLNAVSVRFDACGGMCGDISREVEFGEPYGEVMNVYPMEDERQMQLTAAKVDLRQGWIIANIVNETTKNAFVNYFTTNVIPQNAMGGKWTYVIDMLELEGGFTSWAIGQTGPTNWNVYAQLNCGYIGSAVKAGEKRFLVLDSTKWGEKCNMLDRAYIHLKPGQHLKAKFRVSLFAGTGVNEANYHYVKPGETIACSLPIPTRDGYAFLGWYDGDQRVTEATKVEKREAHTLKAQWRKRQ